MITETKLARADEARLFQYKSTIRRGVFHRVIDLETGAVSVITQAAFEGLKPILDDENKFQIRRGDELPASLLRGLSVAIQK